MNINKIIKNAYKDYDDRTKGYTHSLFIVLKDKKSLEYYDKNILHNMIKSTVIKPLLDIDVESSDNPNKEEKEFKIIKMN